MSGMSEVSLVICKKIGKDFRLAGSYPSEEQATMVGDALLAAKAAVGYRVTKVIAEKFLPEPAAPPTDAQVKAAIATSNKPTLQDA